jgi:hypothetical protein
MRKNRFSLLPAAVLLLLIFAPCFAFGQFDNGSFVGTVHDRTGAVVPDAVVTVLNKDTGIQFIRKADASGNYEVPSVRVGRYRITATHSGFNTAVADNITLSVGTRQRVDLTLQVGGASQTVEVSNVAEQLETESSERGQVVTQYQTEAFPLVNRTYSQLIGLTTGVRQSSIGTGSVSLVREGSFNVEGQRSVFNNFLLDGLDNNAYGTSNQGFSNQIIQPAPDSVAQFQVVTNNESAEYGHASGATINVAFASGTNQLHFDLYEFVRNTDLNAIGYFNPPGGKKPQFNRNQFGGNLGGPILKDRAFYFVDYEGFRQVRKVLSFSSLPTTNQRAGIFAEPIKNPFTGEIYPANTPLPQNVLSPAALRIVALMSATNNPADSTSIANNYEELERFTDYSDKYDARFDFQWSPKSSSFLRLSQRKEHLLDEPPFPLPVGGNGNGNTRIMDQQMAMGYTRQIASNQLLDARLGVSYTKGGKSPLALGTPGAEEEFGIPGLPTDPRVAGGLPTQIITGYSVLGRQYTNPQYQYPFLLNPKVNYSWQMHNHSLKMGYEYVYTRTIVVDVNPLYGLFLYQGAFTFTPSTQAPKPTSENYFADFLFGASSQYNLSNFFVAHLRQTMQFAYLQDDWRVSPRLTLNLGVRYEYGTPYWDKDNNLTNFDPETSPATGQLLHARNGSIYDRSLVNPDRNDFAPRVGFALAVGHNTAIHGGFGVSYMHYNRAGSGNLLAINAPQALFGVVPQGSPTAAGYRRLDQGFPDNLTSPGNFNPLTDNITYVPKNYRDSYVESYFVDVQHQLAKNVLVDVAYVGNHSLKLLEFANYNQKNPANGFARPVPAFSDITYAFNGGLGNYNSLQARYEQRFVHGLTLLNSFTWSRAFDNSTGSLEDPNGNYSSPQNIYNLRADYGPSAYDQPLNNTTSFVYDLPFGRGRAFANGSGLVNEVLGGWQVSAINQMLSGQPITIQYSPSSATQVSGITADYRGANNYRPDRVPGVSILAHVAGKPTLYLNKAAFTTPANAPFGNAARNPIRSHPFYQLDMAANKDFALPSDRMKLQFRAEFYNLLNKTNLQAPPTNYSASNFGTITRAFDARQIQFGLKLVY